jgi:hypothetical protein
MPIKTSGRFLLSWVRPQFIDAGHGNYCFEVLFFAPLKPYQYSVNLHCKDIYGGETNLSDSYFLVEGGLAGASPA